MKLKKIYISIILLFIVKSMLFCIWIPFPKTFPLYKVSEESEMITWSLSPNLIAMGIGISETNGKFNIAINPASSAFQRRINLGFNLGFAPSLNGKVSEELVDFFSTYFMNTNINVPTKAGVFSGIVQYSDAANIFVKELNPDDFMLDKFTGIWFGYSKSFMDRFAFGVNTKIQFCYKATNKTEESKKFDFAVSMDAGFIHKTKNIFKTYNNAGFQDFSWGVSILNLGIIIENSKNIGRRYEFPILFTPGVGAGFNVFNNGKYHVRFLGDMFFPFVSNLQVNLGLEVRLFKILYLKGAYHFDLIDVLEKKTGLTKNRDNGPIIPISFGASFMIDFGNKDEVIKDSGLPKNTISIDIGAKPILNGWQISAGMSVSFGIAEKKPIEIIEESKTEWFCQKSYERFMKES